MTSVGVLSTLLRVFVQAEDGIRDDLVTGVQTCALPIPALNVSSEVSSVVLQLNHARNTDPDTYHLTVGSIKRGDHCIKGVCQCIEQDSSAPCEIDRYKFVGQNVTDKVGGRDATHGQ